MKCKLTVPHDGRPAGTEIEHEEAHLLVEMGLAEPADDECRQMAAIAQENQKMSAARGAQRKKQRATERRARAEALLKQRQNNFAATLGVETADDVQAKAAEKRGS